MDTRFQNLLGFLGGNLAAAEVVWTLAEVSHLWDDIVDGDPIRASWADDVFLSLLLDLPRNPFYQRHIARLLPAFECAVHSWFASRQLEGSLALEDQVTAHVTRFNFADFVATVAELACGRAYALEHAADIRRMVHQETLAEYRTEIAERAAR
jgi:hypothetical protein